MQPEDAPRAFEAAVLLYPRDGVMVKLVLVAGSAVVLKKSRHSLRDRRSPSFARILAWEAILFLILLNLDRGLADSYSPLHIIEPPLLFLALFRVMHVSDLLRVMGKPILSCRIQHAR
jgi:hypothetical protein